MSGRQSDAGKSYRKQKITDVPQEEYYVDGTPLLLNTNRGHVVAKSVHAYTVRCPDCDEEVRYDEDEEPVCPACGRLFTGGRRRPHYPIVRDGKAAGRVGAE